MEKELIISFDETTDQLLETIMKFPQELYNVVPFEGSWTAGQVSEHLLKSESGLPHLLKGHTAKTERAPDEKVAIIKQAFLDFTTKMQSPPFIIPSDNEKDKIQMRDALHSSRQEIRALAETIDLTLTLTDFDMPGMGPITGIEWLNFLICHSKRHIHQLNKIYKAVASTTAAKHI